jgi:UTP-glucose-1-phosphate uridylyltransferase
MVLFYYEEKETQRVGWGLKPLPGTGTVLYIIKLASHGGVMSLIIVNLAVAAFVEDFFQKHYKDQLVPRIHCNNKTITNEMDSSPLSNA